jgi:2-oxoglutarate dehydrogenase complex dehydrogenase (E1) component-like enzyme
MTTHPFSLRAGSGKRMKLGEIIEVMKEAYCGTVMARYISDGPLSVMAHW